MPMGVASTYHARDPYPVYFTHGKGSHIYTVDGQELRDFHNGYGCMVQGHANPIIVEAIQKRAPLGTQFGLPTEDGIIMAEHLASAFKMPKWRFVNSGSEATMDAIRVARGFTGREPIVKMFGSYHGHHDYVMVSIGVKDFGQIGPRDNYKSFSYGAGIPQSSIDLTIPVPFNDPENMVKRIERDGRRGPHAGRPHHGARHDEHGRHPARARLPRGRARGHQEARHRAHLRRGQDGHLHGPRRRGRALGRRARHDLPGQGRSPAARRAA